MKLFFRAATREDIPAILAIENDSFTQPHWVAADFLRFPCTLALMADEVAGFIVVRETFHGDSDSRAEREILNVAVAPRHRRLGVATRLLRNELKSGLIYLLEVRESNIAAQKLYARLGFLEIGRRPKYYRHPPETAIVMQVK